MELILLIILFAACTIWGMREMEYSETIDTLEEDAIIHKERIRYLQKVQFNNEQHILKLRGALGVTRLELKHKSSFTKEELTFILKKIHPDIAGNSDMSRELTRKITGMRKQDA